MDSWEPEDEDDGDGHLAASFPKKNPRVIKEDDGDAESDMDSEDQDQELELATRGAAKRARAGSSAPAEAAAEAGTREAIKAGSDGLLDFDGDTFEGAPVLTGRRGGRYTVNASGGRTYLKRNASGGVVKRGFP